MHSKTYPVTLAPRDEEPSLSFSEEKSSEFDWIERKITRKQKYIYEKQSKCSVKYIPYYYKRLSSPPLKNRLPRAIYKENYKTKYLRLFTPFPNLITKESYNWWVTRRKWGFRHKKSEAKYPKMSVANIWKHSGEFRRRKKWL